MPDDAPRLTYAEERRGLREERAVEAGNVLHEIREDVLDLMPRFDLALGETSRVGAVDAFHARHVDPHFAGAQAGDDDRALVRNDQTFRRCFGDQLAQANDDELIVLPEIFVRDKVSEIRPRLIRDAHA